MLENNDYKTLTACIHVTDNGLAIKGEQPAGHPSTRAEQLHIVSEPITAGK